MNWQQAYELLKEGKHVVREIWEGKYLALLPFLTHIWQIIHAPGANVGNFVPSKEDFEACDWKVLDTTPKPVENPAV